MTFREIAVLGLGSVGRLAAELLQETGFDVAGLDERVPQNVSFPCVPIDASDEAQLSYALSGRGAVLSCLPYDLNAAVATVAHQLGIHYFDLTEDVSTTQRILGLAETSTAVMAPQCGLAPGFVGIVAADLAARLDTCRSLRLRAGALPQHPSGRLGYAFNWSPMGVVNEYLNDCEVIEDGVHKFVSPMEWHETVYVGGTKLEAFTTSGGIGTMCSSYLGYVDNVDYKTLRYPGHVDLMNFLFHELLMRERRTLSSEILRRAKPPVKDDVVYVHIAAEGEEGGNPLRLEYVRSFLPMRLCGRSRTAIAWTTAASAVGVIELVRRGELPAKGFLKQEAVPFASFTLTPTGSLFVESDPAVGHRDLLA